MLRSFLELDERPFLAFSSKIHCFIAFLVLVEVEYALKKGPKRVTIEISELGNMRRHSGRVIYDLIMTDNRHFWGDCV